MPIPIEITHRDVELSPEIEDHIRERAEKLGHFFDRIVGAHITVEGPGGHHKTGGQYRIKVQLAVPGNDVVINHKSSEDLAVAVRDAFDAAKRRLEDHVRRMRGEVKSHQAPSS